MGQNRTRDLALIPSKVTRPVISHHSGNPPPGAIPSTEWESNPQNIHFFFENISKLEKFSVTRARGFRPKKKHLKTHFADENKPTYARFGVPKHMENTWHGVCC
jgi:hypothetical protein